MKSRTVRVDPEVLTALRSLKKTGQTDSDVIRRLLAHRFRMYGRPKP